MLDDDYDYDDADADDHDDDSPFPDPANGPAMDELARGIVVDYVRMLSLGRLLPSEPAQLNLPPRLHAYQEELAQRLPSTIAVVNVPVPVAPQHAYHPHWADPHLAAEVEELARAIDAETQVSGSPDRPGTEPSPPPVTDLSDPRVLAAVQQLSRRLLDLGWQPDGERTVVFTLGTTGPAVAVPESEPEPEPEEEEPEPEPTGLRPGLGLALTSVGTLIGLAGDLLLTVEGGLRWLARVVSSPR